LRASAGLSQLDVGSFGRIGLRALAYYITTTCCAVIIGICCVLAIHPGDPSIKGKLGAGEEDRRVLTIDAFLDLIRSAYMRARLGGSSGRFPPRSQFKCLS